MSSSRRREVPTEGSWRLVDGENESFDTRYLSSFDEDDLIAPMSSGHPSSGYPTQLSFAASQGGMSFASQDSIRDFTNHQDDEQVILREPFRPTVPPSVTSGSTATSRPSLYYTPELQLRMPRIDIDSDMASSGRDSLRTSRGWQWNQSSNEGLDYVSESEEDDYEEEEEIYTTRSRRRSSHGQSKEALGFLRNQNTERDSMKPKLTNDRSSKLSPRPLYNVLGRTFSFLRLLFGYLIIPVILSSGIYFFYNSDISTPNIMLEPLSISLAPFSLAPFSLAPLSLDFISLDSISLAPICRIPGASHLNLPFCESTVSEVQNGAVCNIDFKDLISAQAKFEDILSKGRYGSAIPLELKGSEIATRSLRGLLKESDIPSRNELIFELSSYIEKVGRASSDLQTFYIHIGSTVDSVININRWTLRHMSSLSVEPETPNVPPIVAWAAWVVSYFRPSQQDLTDRILLEKYAEHIVLIQDRLERLTDEGSALALLLSHSKNHLSVIQERAKSPPHPVPSKPDSLLAGILSYIGGIVDEQRDLREQLDLLEKVDEQYSDAISYLVTLIDELKDIHAELGDLLRRSSEPATIWDDEDAPSVQSTLHEQIDMIKTGIRKLESAKRRNAESNTGREYA
ncbi:hypothetical protein PT974_06074 [Cladobotryum mycophilum]|uniref:Uncharacterized protein n=1 Tax=Cladobotryum mycophilum TaxID=491253 RepID=A0ABR0SKT9_9HYPO